MSFSSKLPVGVRHKIERWQQISQPAPLLLTGDIAACRLVVEYLVSKQHVGDVVRIGDSTHATISIKAIRTALEKASSTSWGAYRLVIIEQAERLSIPAANALLKSLEESPRGTRFVLVTAWRRRLLPTLLSRCERIFLIRPAVTDHQESPELGSSMLTRLTSWSGSKQLTDDDLASIGQLLSTALRTQGLTPNVKRGFMRLRDYYRVMAQRGGNVKLARDVLLVSLPERS